MGLRFQYLVLCSFNKAVGLVVNALGQDCMLRFEAFNNH